MTSTFFSDYLLAVAYGSQLRQWPAGWDDSLARQQEIYEELLASQELERERPAPASARKAQPLSVREITQNLVGWSLPGAGAPLGGGQAW